MFSTNHWNWIWFGKIRLGALVEIVIKAAAGAVILAAAWAWYLLMWGLTV